VHINIGLDWSEKKHDIVFANPAGVAVARLTITHTADGLQQFDLERQKLGVPPAACTVGLETAHSLVIDFLWAHGYSDVYIIPPSVVNSSRGRFGSSGARTDQTDAFLLADILRTDRARLHPWHPDGLATRQMRAHVSLLLFLTRENVRLSNRLRSVLLRYYPAALEVFSDLQTQISLIFLQHYPTPQAAAALSWADFQAFAQQQGYPQPKHLPVCYAKLQASYPRAELDTVAVYQEQAAQLATTLMQQVQAKLTTQRHLTALFKQHEDAHIFRSLPGAGAFLAPALLVKLGDHRERFPTAASVQALAGTCPVTDSSGRRHRVYFRHACDHEFRFIAQQWARASLAESTWAVAYWQQVRPGCTSDSHALRCLANRWLAILWKVWQTKQDYDETYHMQQRLARSRPRS
jgi:transposase